MSIDEVALRDLIPSVLGVLVRRGADFATAEDAVQTALIRALDTWGDGTPDNPDAWLITVARRAYLDIARWRAIDHWPSGRWR